ncbi:MAG: L-serine ammonia-lyase, iron-sulfur-dependent, subunit alpha, partial [Nanoarchaeota archaeon]|nr:L-serine ammonia-lyase, iron-sulfur-dependent, subunit alpha [Nanoarchaeota archaeon]
MNYYAVKAGLSSDYKRGLQILHYVDKEKLDRVKVRSLKIKPLSLSSLLIYATVNDFSSLIINRHDNIIYRGKPLSLEEVLSKASKEEFASPYEELLRGLAYREVFDSLEEVLNFEGILKLVEDGVKLNLSLATQNLRSGGAFEIVESSVQNYLATLTGVICDGAKFSCALKLASASKAAIQAAYLANKGIRVPFEEGILGETVKETMSNVGGFMRKVEFVNEYVVSLI